MNLLLDTHVFLWWCDDHKRLTRAARQAIASPDNAVYLSVASAWELAIKQALGRVRVSGEIEEAVRSNDFVPLGISFEHGKIAGLLPQHHGDPFDRMLIAQAKVDDLILITHDVLFRPYGVKALWT